MPPRDEQDFENRRQQIIDGALEVFAHKGFERATNKDIAQAAGIGSPGLIYHYFKDKSDLFRQVVEQRVPMLQLLNQTESIAKLPPREALTLIGKAVVSTMENRAALPLFKIIAGEAIRRPLVADMITRIGPGRGFPFLRDYLEQQMDAGVLRRMDAGAAARCFMGPFLAYFLTREIFPMPDAKMLSPETMVATVVDIFLEGMQPRESEPT
ncbi:MAG TPA: TetR/AcrR family transcriptional regulator [Herpetosiphonaceae bacterium]